MRLGRLLLGEPKRDRVHSAASKTSKYDDANVCRRHSSIRLSIYWYILAFLIAWMMSLYILYYVLTRGFTDVLLGFACGALMGEQTSMLFSTRWLIRLTHASLVLLGIAFIGEKDLQIMFLSEIVWFIFSACF